MQSIRWWSFVTAFFLLTGGMQLFADAPTAVVTENQLLS